MTQLEEIKQVEASARTLYTESEVEQAIERMAQEISEHLAESNPLLLCVLNGGIVIAGKLLTRLRFPLQLDAIKVSRYHATTRGSHMQWKLTPSTPIACRTVLIVDDILDEGITLAAVRDYCMAEGAESVHIATLIDKRIGRAKPCRADFTGLATDNFYLFGYGMDYKDYLRNAAGIYACQEFPAR